MISCWKSNYFRGKEIKGGENANLPAVPATGGHYGIMWYLDGSSARQLWGWGWRSWGQSRASLKGVEKDTIQKQGAGRSRFSRIGDMRTDLSWHTNAPLIHLSAHNEKKGVARHLRQLHARLRSSVWFRRVKENVSLSLLFLHDCIRIRMSPNTCVGSSY